MGINQSKLKEEVMAELLKETDFTEKELKLWHKRFSSYGSNKSLTQDAFLKIYEKYFPYGDARKFVTHLFSTFDMNKDGKIDFPEFIKTLNIPSHGSLEQKLKWAFALYDLNSNGYISREEMSEIIDSIYEMIGSGANRGKNISNVLVDRIFKEMDTNDDGQLCLDEFVEGGKTETFIATILQCDKPFQRKLIKSLNKST